MSFNRFSTATAHTPVHITDAQIAGLVAIMTEFRMMDDEEGYVEWFTKTLLDNESYFGGSYEFCNRMDGVRIYIDKNFISNDVTDAYLSNDGKTGRFTDEEVASANRRLEVIFA